MNYTYLSYINPSIYQAPRSNQFPHSGRMGRIDKRGIETLQKQALYEHTISEYRRNGAQLRSRARKGRQRRLRRRCHSKYGILTAKFHLLGAPPLIPLLPGSLLRFEANSILGSKRGWPQGGTLPPCRPRAAFASVSFAETCLKLR